MADKGRKYISILLHTPQAAIHSSIMLYSGMRTIIVGCGPSILQVGSLPHAGEVIYCNGAIQLTGSAGGNIKWFISDHKVTQLAWFERYYARFRNVLHGSAQVAERCRVAVQFEENPWFTWGDYRLLDGVLRGGGSVVGCALQHVHAEGQLAALAGVDMQGRRSLSHDADVYAEDHWRFKIEVLNNLIARYMPGTTSLTPTVLKVSK